MKFFKAIEALCYKHSVIASKHLSAYKVSLFLVLPILVWIVLDRGIWKGDPVGYALNAISLYKDLTTNIWIWKTSMFNGYKGPLIFWIGQFLVPFGSYIGSVNFALMLIPLTASFIALFLLFNSFEQLFHNKLISAGGSLVVAASPLFNGLATGFWIEPMQVAVVSWFVYALIHVSKWTFISALAQFTIALSLAMLTKVSSPLYFIAPAIFFWIIVFKNKPTLKIDRKELFFLSMAFLFFAPTAIFYLANLKAILGFAHFAATSTLFDSDASKLDLWVQNIENGIFSQYSFTLVLVLLLLGCLKVFKQKTYSNFSCIFFVATFQIVLFFFAWIRSSNVDPRYFLPSLPYFAILVCWGLSVINNRIINALTVGIFLIQLIVVNGFVFGFVQLNPSYGAIRPLLIKPDRNMRLLNDLISLATRDSSIVFDLLPELGVAEFQYELAKQNVTGIWRNSSVDIGAFFNYNHQEIDTGKINTDTVWKNVLHYNPDFYITWNSRLSPSLAETEVHKIDKYNAITVPKRWAIADRMKTCNLYERVIMPAYPELLLFKKKKIGLTNKQIIIP